MLQTLTLLFCGTDVETILCKVQDAPGNVMGPLLESVGFRRMFRRLNAAQSVNGACDVDYYQLSVGDWLLSNPYLLQLGGEQLEPLNSDLSRAALVGFVEACTLHGRHEKGVRFYNAWALLTNSEQMTPGPIFLTPLAPASTSRH